MTSEGDQHRVLDIMVEGIALSNASECKASDGGDDLGQARTGGPIPALHMRGEESAKSIAGQFRNRYHE